MASNNPAPRPTKAIYQLDETVRTHLAKIRTVVSYTDLPESEQSLFNAALSGKDGEGYHILETDETIFYAQGGGQPYDTGSMILGNYKFHIEAVRAGENGRILHLGTFENVAPDLLAPGDVVEQRIDSERRDLNSRCHTAGHTIALSVRRLMEKEEALKSITELKASHYPGASFVEFKGIIDGKFKDQIQSQATDFVQQALPIKLYWHKPEELSEKGVITAEGMPIVAGADGLVRVVDIEGAGAYACGGTHVQDTSLVGSIVIKGIKRQKGISKISYTVS